MNRNSPVGRRGLFVAIDGIDGCGKGKTIRRIRPQLEPAMVVHCPNRKTITGSLIKSFLNGGVGYPRMAQIALFEANRWEWAGPIKDALDRGLTVLANRWVQSGMAYAQASGDPYLEAVMSLQEGLPLPDLSIVIDITVEESFRRKPRPEDREILDYDSLSLEKVRQNFLSLARKFSWTVVDGMAEPDVVAARVMELLERTKFGPRP